MHHISKRTTSSALRKAARSSTPSLARGAHKDVRFGHEGRAAMLAGIDTLANAVSATLGPKGVCRRISSLSAKVLHWSAPRGFERISTRVDCQTKAKVLTLLLTTRSQCHHRATVRWTENHQG